MRAALTLLLGMVLMLVALAAGGLAYARVTQLSTRGVVGELETRLARLGRSAALPSSVRARRNPVALTPEVLADGMNHFADHCASCHANTGSGDTGMGRGFYPPAPDMRLPATQDLSDGELFHVIEHGIRFTGMPAWGTGTDAGEESSWRLVHFLRHLPKLTSADVEQMQMRNPRSPEDIRQEIAEERFLSGVTP
jgi:mono/diheme cytochrome c family protein